jgi:hypothetical protein
LIPDFSWRRILGGLRVSEFYIRFDPATIPIQDDRITHEFPILARKAGQPVICFHDCLHTASSIMRSLRIPPIIVAGVTWPRHLVTPPAAISSGCTFFVRV